MNIKGRRGLKIPYLFTETEVMELLNSIPNSRDKMLFTLLYRLALRPNEVVSIDVRDINFGNRNLRFFASKKGSEEMRELPLDETTLENLRYFIMDKKRGFLFPSQRRDSNGKEKALTITQVEQLFNKYCINVFGEANFGLVKYANPEGKPEKKRRWFPYLLRHARAVHLLNKGVNIETIRRILGHTDLNITKIYLDRSIEDIREELEHKEGQIELYKEGGRR